MWTCHNCENQNEENFNFCWSCGKPRTFKSEVELELNTDIPVSKPMDLELENNISQVVETKPIDNRPKKIERKEPEMVVIKPIRHEPAKIPVKKEEVKEETLPEPENIPEKKVEIVKEPEEIKTKIPEPELFSTFLPESQRKNATDTEANWENIGFTIAVRVLGLYFIFLILISIPHFISLAYSFFILENVQIKGFGDLLAIPLFILTAKLLFYLVLGIYLISSGRLVIWLLPSAYSK